jgi:hypothetical protein
LENNAASFTSCGCRSGFRLVNQRHFCWRYSAAWRLNVDRYCRHKRDRAARPSKAKRTVDDHSRGNCRSGNNKNEANFYDRCGNHLRNAVFAVQGNKNRKSRLRKSCRCRDRRTKHRHSVNTCSDPSRLRTAPFQKVEKTTDEKNNKRCHSNYKKASLNGWLLHSVPGEIRTPDRRLRRPLLYPAELLGHGCYTLFSFAAPSSTSEFREVRCVGATRSGFIDVMLVALSS